MVDAELRVIAVFAKAQPPRSHEIPQPPSMATLAPDQIMCRRRMDTSIENPRLVKEHGLVDSNFYHTELEKHGQDKYTDTDDPFDHPLQNVDRIYEERTALFQSLEHYTELNEHPTMRKYVGTPEEALLYPRFGENFLIQGMNADQLCIGDIFEVKGDVSGSKLKIEVTSPRLPCALVDKKNESPFGLKGLKRHCTTYGQAGWFARVLEPGEIQDGTTLCRIANPHPKWTLRYISKALYGEADKRHFALCSAQWARSKEELEELCGLEQLGWYEWKARAVWILERWGRKDVMPAFDAKKSHGRVTGTKVGHLKQLFATIPWKQHAQTLYVSPLAIVMILLAWLGLGSGLLT